MKSVGLTPGFFIMAVCMVVCMGGCSMQNRFLYFPSAERPSVRILEREGVKLWQETAGDYQGLVAAGKAPAPNGTIVLFHGNGGTALDRTFYVTPFMELGFRVILAEYPKYGGRPGTVGEKPFVADGLETVRHASEQYGPPLYVLGESLGCGIAAAVVKQTSVPIAGIILITPWDTLASVAKSLFPFLPVQLVLTDTYDNMANLQSFQKNIAVIGAEHDEILPIRHAINLYDALPEGKKRMWIIKGAGHNDWRLYADTSLFKEIMDFTKAGEP